MIWRGPMVISGAEPDAEGSGLGLTRRAGGGNAAGNRRRATDHEPVGAAGGGR